MADGDPFADLGETLADDTEEEPADTADPGDTEPSVDRRDPTTDPAFSYGEAKQRPFYAREETIGAFDSWLNYDLERELDTRGYENIVVREMTDALLRTVVEEDLVEAVVDRFEAARESAPSESEK